MKRAKDFDDDGHVIAPMNVEGMPWHSAAQVQVPQSTPQLEKRQFRYALWGAMGAALTVAGVLSAGIILFVLFSLKVWLK